MPHVARLNIAPVRSLGLESREEVDLTEHGVAEDRRFYVIDDGGRLGDQLTAGEMVQVAACPHPDAPELPLPFPGGSVVAGTVALGETVDTHVHGRDAVGHIAEGPR